MEKEKMMRHSRDKILSSIRQKLALHNPQRSRDAMLSRLEKHVRNTIPERTNLPDDALITLFVSQAENAGATVTTTTMDSLEQSLQYYCDEHSIKKVKIATSPLLQKIDWKNGVTEFHTGPAGIEDTVSITECFSAVAETGTLVLISGKESPTTLNFLTEIHIVVVQQKNIVASYEDVWDKVRELSQLPRCINLITGPSRTGDIEQKILVGAHGPRELVIFLVLEMYDFKK
jgi:L-lactate dehydrogenase complex protein LldG